MIFPRKLNRVQYFLWLLVSTILAGSLYYWAILLVGWNIHDHLPFTNKNFDLTKLFFGGSWFFLGAWSLKAIFLDAPRLRSIGWPLRHLCLIFVPPINCLFQAILLITPQDEPSPQSVWDALKFACACFKRVLLIEIQFSIVACFIVWSCVAIYGVLFPWPEADSAIRQEGIQGTRVLVGATANSSLKHLREPNGTIYTSWNKNHTRSYIAITITPLQLVGVNYSETFGSDRDGVQRNVQRDSNGLIVLILFWIVAGYFSIRWIPRWIAFIISETFRAS